MKQKLPTWTCPICGFKAQGHYDGEKKVMIHMRNKHIIYSEE